MSLSSAANQNVSVEEKVAMKLEKHLNSNGLSCSLLDDGTMDFEYDYPRDSLEKPIEGISSRGVMSVQDAGFDYLDILKHKTISDVPVTTGSPYGDWYKEGILWRFRFFLCFPPKTTIGPLNIGTLTKVMKGRLHSKIEDFIWNGYGKLTTLPPGLIRDNVMESLSENKRLRELMMNCLLKEKTIKISVYRPKTKVNYEELKKLSKDSWAYKYKPKKESNAKIVMTSSWKPQKLLFLDKDTIEMYSIIGKTIKQMVETLKYHLEENSTQK